MPIDPICLMYQRSNIKNELVDVYVNETDLSTGFKGNAPK